MNEFLLHAFGVGFFSGVSVAVILNFFRRPHTCPHVASTVEKNSTVTSQKISLGAHLVQNQRTPNQPSSGSLN